MTETTLPDIAGRTTPFAWSGSVAPSSSADRLALDAVFEIAKVLAAAPDPIATIPEVLAVLGSRLGLKHGSLALLDEPAERMTSGDVNPYKICATAIGVPPGIMFSDFVPEAALAMVFRTGVPLVSWHLTEELGPRALPRQLSDGPHGLISVPVREQFRTQLVVGVLSAYRPHEVDFAGQSKNDLNVMTMVASLLEQALSFRRSVARDRARAINDNHRSLMEIKRSLSPDDVPSIDGIVGTSPSIVDVLERVQKVAGTGIPVLLRGESGTGKELFARALHDRSPRKTKAFVRVNCAALSETLLESELFGHEKGAFTGAAALKKGRFEMADGGTLFLDEIGEISPAFQAKLLRVLQEGEFERVGGTKTIKVDVRLVTATNRDLEEAVAKGDFRADLYFRICVVPIVLPPLRDRPTDIRPLATLFLERFNKENKTTLRFSTDAFDTLCACKFPGNVRELENCVSRAAALASDDVISGAEMACRNNACLSAELWRLQSGEDSPVGGLAAGHVVSTIAAPPVRDRSEPLPPASPAEAPVPRKTANTGRDELVAAMEEAGWVQAKAARLLGMTPRQIAYALKKHDIEIRRI